MTRRQRAKRSRPKFGPPTYVAQVVSHSAVIGGMATTSWQIEFIHKVFAEPKAGLGALLPKPRTWPGRTYEDWEIYRASPPSERIYWQ